VIIGKVRARSKKYEDAQEENIKKTEALLDPSKPKTDSDEFMNNLHEQIKDAKLLLRSPSK
jgi:hypothetical protein